MGAVALKPLIDEAWSLVTMDEKARAVRLTCEVPNEAQVLGNADRLLQVFVNLLRNAVIALETRGEVAVRARRDGTRWLIAVEDNGPGIPEDVLPDIFNAFVSSRLDARGTGLGLTVAQAIVDQHGGRLSAANRPAGGARLEVILPAAA
jgi:signal transduction histidine kinase